MEKLSLKCPLCHQQRRYFNGHFSGGGGRLPYTQNRQNKKKLPKFFRLIVFVIMGIIGIFFISSPTILFLRILSHHFILKRSNCKFNNHIYYLLLYPYRNHIKIFEKLSLYESSLTSIQ